MTMGIYAIENIENNKVYIGQSKNVEKRLSNHKKLLKNGSHYNIHLQNSFNIYGENKFSFRLIEEISNPKLLNKAENKWIEIYNSFIGKSGYNIQYPIKSYKRLVRKTTWYKCKVCGVKYGLFEEMFYYDKFYYQNLCSRKCWKIHIAKWKEAIHKEIIQLN